MKRFFLLGVCCILFISCKKNNSEAKQSTINTLSGFKLNGTLENFYPKKVYLNKIIENSIYPIDSSEVLDNHFIFTGVVEYPERYSLTFENYSSTAICIIENVEFDLFINANYLNDPIIKGSKANSILNQYKVQSKQIFKKIDYLFPLFQKARLENNIEKLANIRDEMEKIEIEFTNFSYNFIIQNNKSYVAPMILRDLLKSSKIDTLKIKKTYQALPDEIKKSLDSQIIASFLGFH
jgi:uncharacterized protein DUF4369